MMQLSSQRRSSILMIAGELLIGLLLLINPTSFTRWIIIIFGLLTAALGILSCVQYFSGSAEAGVQSQGLARGLSLLIAGVFCALRSDWLLATFPALTILYGAVIMLTGLYKLQQAIDIVRLQTGRALMPALTAVLTLILAAIILLNPFATIQALWMFIGIVLIIEASLELLAMLLQR